MAGGREDELYGLPGMFAGRPGGADAGAGANVPPRPYVPGARPDVPLRPQPARTGVAGGDPGAAAPRRSADQPAAGQTAFARPPFPTAPAMPGVAPGAAGMPAMTAMPAPVVPQGGTPFTIICPEGYLPVIKFVKIPERTPRDEDPAGNPAL